MKLFLNGETEIIVDLELKLNIKNIKNIKKIKELLIQCLIYIIGNKKMKALTVKALVIISLFKKLIQIFRILIKQRGFFKWQ